MTSSGAAAVYRIFKKSEGAASVRSVVVAMVIVACTLTGLGVVRVTRQHEVLALGYQLDRESEHLRQQKEINRRLQVELATRSSPDRIRRLATELGMTPVPPDRIRIIDVPSRKKVAAQ
ncbi:MAG TPA: cell division protein FtsL [Kofleriaceae bacterium]|nr:cell division protein FtsL [Kofleriaceae bacterium]